ncbi:hypothetical protein MC5_04420 [Rickettsia australis str. Cutlack]|uniref:Uncharacterized protein n=1 Tax=Rickettsia australis (strain Cutlack) TaxID=1105110 RepID=H8K7E7_RICAC|nr:hypothetical protein MC5_04420 [Rickettsia australis str. Cutlack]
MSNYSNAARDKCTNYFQEFDTPNIEIALACRASASIPLV